jgi:hypothetical protein
VPDAGALCGRRRPFALDRCSQGRARRGWLRRRHCTFGTSHDIHGHANWWPAYTGYLHWRDASIDLDYTFDFEPEGQAALVTSNDGVLHVEFDSSEQFYDTPWWNRLRDAAASGTTTRATSTASLRS